METKTCTKCGEEKPQTLEFFPKRPPSHVTPTSGYWMPECKSCRNKRSNKWATSNRNKVNKVERKIRQNRKAWLDSLKDSPCLDCGIKYPPYVMDFDHLPGTTKVMDLSKALARKWSRAKLLEEIAKCELVCSNCHRIRGEKRKQALRLTSDTLIHEE